ncbi:MAG: M20/M25/M40 family metallo-hydrolase [Bacteroidales bacterium]|nr:M20/M25/M40 family metallo-hydrolase [Bacteroidales bacterium]
MIDLELFIHMLDIESTSGSEGKFSDFLLGKLEAGEVHTYEVGDGTRNLLFTWGEPKIVFCTHMDTVPPYIPPRIESGRIWGRGACDAKGQIISMYTACKELEKQGCTDFALLLVSGEETGSHGAKAFDATGFRADTLIIGEPTENKMVSACKGTKGFGLAFKGEAFHSGYPQWGSSAVDAFLDYFGALKEFSFPEDSVLGPTTWNIGMLSSQNPQNVLSPSLSCRLYFRTTFASDGMIAPTVKKLAEGLPVEITESGGDKPSTYFTLEGFPTAPVSFGSDAPHLNGFLRKIIYGPGSIRFAHRDDEHVDLEDLLTAVKDYVEMYHMLQKGIS